MKNGPALRAFLDNLHRETFAVLTDLREYISAEVADPDETVSLQARAAMIREAMLATQRMAHVMAWLMLQKAVDAGEISTREAESHAANEFGANPDAGQGEAPREDLRALPVELRGLIDRSRRAYGQALVLKARAS